MKTILIRPNSYALKLLFTILIPSMIPIFSYSQAFEIEGSIKVGQMEMRNNCDSLVVVMPDGTFALRDVSTIPGGSGGTIQSLSMSEDTLFISNSNYVVLPESMAGSSNQDIAISNDTIYLSDGGYAVLPSDNVNDADNNTTNELQELSIHGDTLFISDGNHVILPENSASGTNQSLSMSEDTIHLSNGGYVILPPDGINDSDSDPTNEIQDLSVVGDTVFISNGDYIVLPGLKNIQYWDISVQERLDRGSSPIDIYRLGFPLDSIYGRNYKGGRIFYIDPLDEIPNLEGLVAYPFDIDYNEELYIEWGCSVFYNPITPATNTPPTGPTADLGTGASNTNMIAMDDCMSGGDKAINLVDGFIDGQHSYDDWHLPSIQELKMMYDNIGPNSNNTANLQSDSYWSSTPSNNFETWRMDFSSGTIISDLRTNKYRVRPIRSF